MKIDTRKVGTIFLILVILVIALAATSIYFYIKFSSKNPALLAQNEAKALSETVGKIILLPTDEIPTIATVSDPQALKDQAFFVDAQKGYKVLIYSNAKKAVLYDPATNKIINFAPLNISDQKNSTPAASPIITPSTAPKNTF